MKKDKIIGVIIVIIGAFLLITGTAMSINLYEKNNETKNEENAEQNDSTSEEDTTIEYIIDGIKYVDYRIIEKNEAPYFKINITNTTENISSNQTMQVTVLSTNNDTIDIVRYELPEIKPNISKDYEFKYTGKALPKEYKVNLNIISPSVETTG